MIAISNRTVVAGEHLALVGGGLHDGAAPGCPPLVHPPVRLDMPQPRAVHLRTKKIEHFDRMSMRNIARARTQRRECSQETPLLQAQH